MSEFHAEKNGERLSVVSSDWSFLSDDPAPGLFSLKIKDAISIESLPAELGESPETVALPERRRLHRLSGGKEIALECTGTIPFGTSPEIRRKYRFFENEMIVVSDFLLRHSFPMKQISAGGLKFSGPFRRFGILSAPQSGSALLPPVQWTSLLPSDVSAPQTEEAGRPEPCCCRTKKTETSEKPQKSAQARESKKQNMTEEKTPKEKVEKTLLLYRSSAPPLSFLLECEGEKSVLRFRIGEDCWRWIHAARLNGESVFSIFRTGEGEILFTWNLLEWKGKTEDEEPPPGRNWRLSWSLDWTFPERRRKKAQQEVRPVAPGAEAAGGEPVGDNASPASGMYRSVFDMESFPWKADALCRDAEGKIPECRCACASSASVLNALKRWLRSCLGTASERDVFAVVNAQTHFCFSAAHMERPKLQSLPHWDAAPLEEFRRWANRQLAPSGAELLILGKTPGLEKKGVGKKAGKKMED